MAEYIERGALKEVVVNLQFSKHLNKDAALTLMYKAVNNLPSADVAPVRHGRWIEPSRLYYGAKQYECSLCYSDTFWKKHSITEKYPHCPNCGAKMDGCDGNSAMV